MNNRIHVTRYLLFIYIAVSGAAADLVSKHMVFTRLGLPGEYWLIDDFLALQTTVNQGALFGMGQGGGMIFVGFSVVAAIGILYWLFVAKAAKDPLLTVALACVMAGIIGNAHDRLGLWRHPDIPALKIYGVRDWILFKFGSFPFPNFNIADSLLVCGAALLLLCSLLQGKPVPQSAGADIPQSG